VGRVMQWKYLMGIFCGESRKKMNKLEKKEKE
jgi:hypothetical protein